MSGGVNIKVISQSQGDAAVSSTLPLPRSMVPLTKMDPRQQFSSLPNPTVQYPHSAKRRPSYSSSPASSGSTELLRGTALKTHLLQQKAGVYSHRSPAATERTDGTCSAYSSPQVPKREVPRSKDTLDIRTSALTQKALRDLQLRRNTNKNWTFGKYRLRMVDNTEENTTSRQFSSNVQLGQGGARLLYSKGSNGNEIPGMSMAVMGNVHQDMRNTSNQDLRASEGGQSGDKSRSSYQTFNMPRRASEPGKVNMAAVAPFRFRFQVQEEMDAPLDDLSDCSSDSMEVCCDEPGGMLGNSVKGREGDLKMERTDSTKAYGQAEGKGVGMAAKRAKSGVPQSTQRGELKVYRAGSSEGRLPVSSSLRKQRSMTNLAILTDAEKKLHLYEPKWCDDMAKPGAGQNKTGKPKTAGGGSTAGGGAPLSRNLSKSEHSLFQGKPKPFSPLAAPTALSKQSRIPRGPYAEVKPLSKAPEDGKSDDEILSCKAKAGAKKQGAGAGGVSGSKGQGDEGDDKAFLKVDPELVVTVLGDLEQLLFSQMLDPESQRKRTVQNVLDLRQNLEDTMSSLRGAQLSHSTEIQPGSIDPGLNGACSVDRHTQIIRPCHPRRKG